MLLKTWICATPLFPDSELPTELHYVHLFPAARYSVIDEDRNKPL